MTILFEDKKEKNGLVKETDACDDNEIGKVFVVSRERCTIRP